MREVGTLEARNSLSALLEEVEKGEEITITRHGRPIARLVAPLTREERKARAREAVAWIRANRQPNALRGMSLRDLIEEGRRY